MGHHRRLARRTTLVVDTVALRPETWLDPLGTPHSDALHMVERFRRPSRDTLEVEFHFDDPKTFTKPWGGKGFLSAEQYGNIRIPRVRRRPANGQPREAH